MIVDGFFDWSERIDGPKQKLWEDNDNKEAVFFHSAVGTLQGTIDTVLEYPQPKNPRSVTGVIGEDGHLVQFYPIWASPWANASHEWNTKAIGIEFAGGYNARGHAVNEPLTDLQNQSAIRLLLDLAEYKGVNPSYWQRPTTLKEHREVYATACPSDRIQWDIILYGLHENKPRVFLYGDEKGGMEKRGSQLILWNENVEIWAYGDVPGTAVGQTWHNVAGIWQKVAE